MITQKIEQDEIFKLLGVPQQAIEKKRYSAGSRESVDFEDAKYKLEAIKIQCFEDLQEIQKRYEAASQVLDSIEKFYAIFNGLESPKKEKPIEQTIEQPVEQPQNNPSSIVLHTKYPNCHILQKLATRKKPFDTIKVNELRQLMGYKSYNTIYSMMEKGRAANQETIYNCAHGYCGFTSLGQAKIKDILEEEGEIVFVGKCAQVVMSDVIAKGYTTHYRIQKTAGYNKINVSRVVRSLKDSSDRNLLQQNDDGRIRMADWTKNITFTVK